MENKEIKITPPEGYEIDKENSTFKCIKFKKKAITTYEDIARVLFKDESGYYIETGGYIGYAGHFSDTFADLDNATSEKQLEKLFAINKLMNVAKYLNGGWKPDWKNDNEYKYSIYLNKNKICIDVDYIWIRSIVYFRTEELAKQAIDILGEETIRLALSTDW